MVLVVVILNESFAPGLIVLPLFDESIYLNNLREHYIIAPFVYTVFEAPL